MKTATDSPPIQFRSFHNLKYSTPHSESDGGIQNIAMRLLLPSSTSYQIAYGLTGSNVLCAPLKDMDEPDQICFGPGGNIMNIVLLVLLSRGYYQFGLLHLEIFKSFIVNYHFKGNVILGTGYALETEKPLLFTLSHGMVTLR